LPRPNRGRGIRDEDRDRTEAAGLDRKPYQPPLLVKRDKLALVSAAPAVSLIAKPIPG